ncbi:Fibrocystin-L [Lamellibrachia satsuma]|nr:Fibrocystin-L [Lamellibrachia satsuma]
MVFMVGLSFRAYMGGINCELLDELGNIKELLLDGASGEKTTGHFKCSIDSKYIGGMNLSFIVENEYGRSMPALQMLRVLSHDKICMFESFAEVTEVSPSSGGTEGGTFLHIRGTGLDDTTDAETQVLVGGAVCDIESVTADKIVCLTPKPLDSNKNSFEAQSERWLRLFTARASLPDKRPIVLYSASFLLDSSTATVA